jgi:multisubunit Na+/H+ antiporter MnhB subunit
MEHMVLIVAFGVAALIMIFVIGKRKNKLFEGLMKADRKMDIVIGAGLLLIILTAIYNNL